MALKDVVDGIENRIDHLFDKNETDPVRLREPVLADIGRAHDQWTSAREGEAHHWWSVSNGLVAFSPTLPGGAPLTIDGQTTNFIPADRFPDYLAAMRREVEAGTFDAEIAGGMAGSGNVSGVASVPMPEARAGEVRESEGAPDHRL